MSVRQGGLNEDADRNCNDDVLMTFQHLYNLSRLQIPDVRLVILAASHDPLATCHAEARRYAVLRIDVAGICFETARRLIIPQANGTIMGRRKNIFRVGRELNLLTASCQRQEPKKFDDVVTHQMASCPSARVFRHCPSLVFHIRLCMRLNLEHQPKKYHVH